MARPQSRSPVPAASARGLRIALVVSRYNEEITSRLRDGAAAELQRLGGDPASLVEAAVPGAFELPVACAAAARSGRYDAVVALGCIIRGETTHDLHLATAVATSLATISAETGVPVAFGVLTVQSLEQADARAGGAWGNKGAEALRAAVEAVAAVRALAGPRPPDA